MEQIVFDIETGGLPKDEILYLMPEFNAPSNYKDAEKIQAYKAKKEEEWLLDSALSALSGRVLAIGVQKLGKPVEFFTDDDEVKLLSDFWNFYRQNASATFVGFNSNSFYIPFLVRRSWANKVIVPNIFRGKFLSYNFVDLMQIWGCGTAERVSLDTLAKFFGVGAKNGDGADFSSMWAINRESALRYLSNDVLLTRAVGEAMCVISEMEVSDE